MNSFATTTWRFRLKRARSRKRRDGTTGNIDAADDNREELSNARSYPSLDAAHARAHEYYYAVTNVYITSVLSLVFYVPYTF